MEKSSSRLVKLILGEVALLFILIVLVNYIGSFVGAEPFKEVLSMLLRPAVMVVFVFVITLLFLLLLKPIFETAFNKFFNSYEAQYTWQFIKYTVWIASLIILTFLLVGDILSLSIFVVLLLVVFVIMFHKALMNFAGWLYIISQRRLKMGDLLEVYGIKGRIVGVTIMNTILAETNEYLGKERQSHREVMMPNSFVFSIPVFSISPKKSLVWDEIKVLLPAKVDHLLARDIMTQVANSIAGPIMKKHRQEMMKKASSPGEVPSMPSTVISLEPEGVLVVLTYFCQASERSEVRSIISEDILNEFRKEGIKVAFRDTRA